MICNKNGAFCNCSAHLLRCNKKAAAFCKNGLVHFVILKWTNSVKDLLSRGVKNYILQGFNFANSTIDIYIREIDQYLFLEKSKFGTIITTKIIFVIE